MTPNPSPPQPDAVLSDISSSFQHLSSTAAISIDQAAIDHFLKGLQESEWKQEGDKPIRLPLRFDTKEDEVNVLCLIFLLSGLSPFSSLLRKQTTRGPFSSILLLLLSSYLSHPSSSSDKPLSTTYLLTLSPASLAESLQLKTHNEKDHPTLGPVVKVGEKDEEVWRFLESVCGVAKETGKILKGEKKESFGAWMTDASRDTKGDGGKLVVKLATTFPAFNDAFTLNEQPIYFYRKALLLVQSIVTRFAPSNLSPEDHESPLDFTLPTFKSSIPRGSDNLVSSSLISLKILDLSSSSDSTLSSFSLPTISAPMTTATTMTFSTESAIRLRAASLAAFEAILTRAKELGGWLEKIEAADLESFLRTKAKAGKEVQVWTEESTTFY